MVVAGAWTFGWDALVALGTIGLALVTAGLAWLTRGLARASAADLTSQWRPVILPGGDSPAPIYEADMQRLIVPLRNAGRGPALFVRTLLDPYGASPSNWSLGAVAPGDTFRLYFDGVQRLETAQVLLDYRDLSGRLYSSAIVIDTQGTRFYDVRLMEGMALTPHGDAVPQPGLRSVSPAPRPPLRQRLAVAWEALLGRS